MVTLAFWLDIAWAVSATVLSLGTLAPFAAAIVLLAPYRVVIVSRGYRRWLIFLCFAVVAVLVITGELGLFTLPAFAFGLFLFLATAGRRVAFDQIPYVEITGIEQEACEVTLTIAHGRLAPRVVLRTKREPAATHLAARLHAIVDAVQQGGEDADDAFVTSALRQLEEAYETA